MSIYRELLEKRPPFKPLRFGHTEDGEAITLGYDLLQRHVHILGLSRMGKSYFLQDVLRQMLLNRQGFTLIDPHGELYEGLLKWIALQHPGFTQTRNIHLLDPSNRDWRFGYNPIHIPKGLSEDERDAIIVDKVDALKMAVAQVMSGEDPDTQPRYSLIFSVFIYTLATHGLTVLEALRLIPRTAKDWREYLSDKLPNPVIAQLWLVIESWEPKEFTNFLESFVNRIGRLLWHPFIYSALSQTDNVFDAKQVMDGGEFVLINLQPKQGAISWPSARLLARLLINDYTQTAMGRKAGKSTPHFLVVDEAHHFLTTDVNFILDQTAKFGLHFMLAHQRLAQLSEYDEKILSGVVEGAQNKVIFRTTHQTGLELADQLFAHRYELERPVEALQKPTVVGVEKVPLHGAARAVAEGSSFGSAYGSSSLLGTSHVYEGLSLASELSHSNISSFGSSDLSSSSDSHVVSNAESVHEAFKPIYETLPSAVHGLDKERHRFAVGMSQTEQQHFVLRDADGGDANAVANRIRIPFVSEENLAAVTERMMDQSDFVSPAALVKEDIKGRWEIMDESLKAWKEEKQEKKKGRRMPKNPRDRFE